MDQGKGGVNFAVIADCAMNQPCVGPPPAICAPNGVCVAPGGAGGVAVPEQNPQAQSFGFPRDTFWPRSALAFVVIGVVLTLISTQLVAPTRRFRLFRRWGRRPARLPALASTPGPIPQPEATLGSDVPSEVGSLDPDPADPRDPPVDEVHA
jgi:hypothetical protein